MKYSTATIITPNSFLQRKMLCRKKLVIVLTLTCLVLLYVSANHLLQNEDPENNTNALQNSNTIGSSSSSSSNHNAKEDSLQVDNSVRKFEQDSMRNMIYYQSDKNVEFRTSKPNSHKRLCKYMEILSNFIN